MRENQNRWEQYKWVLEKRVADRLIQWVATTAVFSFLAGVNTICALFGGRVLPHFGIALVVYALSTSYVCVALFGLALVRVLRRQSKSS
jgi:Na+/H+-dicarboxylate symporter